MIYHIFGLWSFESFPSLFLILKKINKVKLYVHCCYEMIQSLFHYLDISRLLFKSKLHVVKELHEEGGLLSKEFKEHELI